MHGGAAQGRINVFATVTRRAPDLFGFPVVDDMPVTEPFTDVDVREQRGSRTIDVEFRVVAGIAAVGNRQLDEFFSIGEQRVVHALQ